MRMRHGWITKRIAIVMIACLVATSDGLLVAAAQSLQSPPAAIPATPVTTPNTVNKTEASDIGWPRAVSTFTGASLVLYQPQIASWENQTNMVLHVAVSYTPVGGQRQLGTIKVTTETKVSVPERLVEYSTFQISEATFPTLSKTQLQEVTSEISTAARGGIISLDRVLARLDKSSLTPKNVEGVKADPPQIFFSKTPAALINMDGAPIWGPIKGTDLQFAINTNWDLFQHVPSQIYYLRYNESWLRTSTLEGGWVPAKVPDSFKKLPDEENWKEVKEAVPGKKLSGDDAPRVFYTTQPAELILIKGEPKYLQVGETTLFWVSNTDSDVFRVGKAGTVYYLVSGRWFSAPDFTGPWTFASLNLPEDFKKIPVEHERSHVLASVPGTDQAAEAVLLAQIPQTARVNKKTVMAPEVMYQGEPQFEPIKMTQVSRAVNTDKDVIKFGDLYYLCFQGVWFMSRNPAGPWEVTGQIPKEIYEIPPESPSHNVTYVTVVEDDDDDVMFATAIAYTGMMVAWGCVVWGSGYYYPPYWGGGFYYPRYPTYGVGAWYNPWTGGYGRGMAGYGPYGGAGVGARYNPATGTYARGAAAYGPYGSRAAGSAYNSRTGAYGATRQGSNVYGSWGSTGVARGDQWATTSRVTNNVTGNTTRVTRTDQGGAVSRTGPGGGGFVGTSAGDVYAGRDGNVYRNEGGSWQKYDNGSWNNVQATPEQRQQAQDRANQAAGQGQNRQANTARTDPGTYNQLNQDRATRTEGAQRSSDSSAVRSNPAASSSRSSGSYRPSGGGAGRARAGGGGGRRR